MHRAPSSWFVALSLLALACALAGSASAQPKRQPTVDQLRAMYVIDHSGSDPANAAALVAYAQPYVAILGSCSITPVNLANLVLNLAEQASVNGGREVTNLDMLQTMAESLSWASLDHHRCVWVFDVAEAAAETGMAPDKALPALWNQVQARGGQAPQP